MKYKTESVYIKIVHTYYWKKINKEKINCWFIFSVYTYMNHSILCSLYICIIGVRLYKKALTVFWGTIFYKFEMVRVVNLSNFRT